MVSTYGYTTEAKVKERITNYNTAATSSQIDTFINHAEGLIISITGEYKWEAVPLLIEGAATDIAALYLLASDPSGFTNIIEAAFIADVLWASARRAIKLLNDERVIKNLKAAA